MDIIDDLVVVVRVILDYIGIDPEDVVIISLHVFHLINDAQVYIVPNNVLVILNIYALIIQLHMYVFVYMKSLTVKRSIH